MVFKVSILGIVIMVLGRCLMVGYLDPEGKICLRLLIPKTTKGVVFGTRDLKYWVLGPSGKQHAYP